MDNKDILRGKLHDWINKAEKYSMPVFSKFLNQTEISFIKEIILEERLITEKDKIGDLYYFFFGGQDENDAACLFLLPDFFSLDDFKNSLNNETSTIACLHIYPKNEKYAEELTHRDVLGSLMSLGFERNEFGDILIQGYDVYLFLLDTNASVVSDELKKIRNTYIKIEKIPPSSCPIHREFEEREIRIPSLRIDAILGEVFYLSRSVTEELLSGKNVFLSGETITEKDFKVKENSRISVRGYGKFVFLGVVGESKKGKLIVSVKIYK